MRTWGALRQRGARCTDWPGVDGGLPHSHMPGSMGILYQVIGFQPPANEPAAMTTPVGAKAARISSITMSDG